MRGLRILGAAREVPVRMTTVTGHMAAGEMRCPEMRPGCCEASATGSCEMCTAGIVATAELLATPEVTATAEPLATTEVAAASEVAATSEVAAAPEVSAPAKVSSSSSSVPAPDMSAAAASAVPSASDVLGIGQSGRARNRCTEQRDRSGFQYTRSDSIHVDHLFRPAFASAETSLEPRSLDSRQASLSKRT